MVQNLWPLYQQVLTSIQLLISVYYLLGVYNISWLEGLKALSSTRILSKGSWSIYVEEVDVRTWSLIFVWYLMNWWWWFLKVSQIKLNFILSIQLFTYLSSQILWWYFDSLDTLNVVYGIILPDCAGGRIHAP